MRPLLPISIALAALLPVRALEVSGNVLTKMGAPIAGAQVCVKSVPGSCVATGPQGEFRLDGAIAIRSAPRSAARFSLSRAGGSLRLESPAAVPARLEWFSSDGRTRWAASDLDLAAGSNVLALPPGLPHTGLCLLRLSTADETLAWKAVLASGPVPSPRSSSTGRSEAGSSAAPRIAALSKAAASLLEVSKPGYRTRIYQPRYESDTGAVIHLNETGDTGLVYTGGQTTHVYSIDRAEHRIITVDSNAYCAVTDPLPMPPKFDTAYYALREGRLWLWKKPNCYGSLFAGTSSDPVGRWTPIEPNAPLPADLQAGCAPGPIGSIIGIYENLGEELTITESGISTALTIGICPGDYIANELANEIFYGEPVTLAKSTCMRLTYQNDSGQTGTFDFSKAGDSLHVAFSAPGGTCVAKLGVGIPEAAPSCRIIYEWGFDRFLGCVVNAGFGHPLILVKTAAPMSKAPAAKGPP